MEVKEVLWPQVTFYSKQLEVIRSVEENDETFVPAGNMLGKDFVAGFLAVAYLLSRHPVRVVSTSVKDDHLRILWGEILRFVQTAKFKLRAEDGGPLIVNHREIKKMYRGEVCPTSYLIGCVSEKGEGMAGHHAPNTFFLGDEASGIEDVAFTQADTWASAGDRHKRKLIIGNPNPCTNFFNRGVKDGDLPYSDEPGRFHRKIIRIRADDSPNVRYGMAEERAGLKPSGRTLIPGVISYSEYKYRRKHWDKVRQCIGLDGDFWEGAEVLMFPPEWLNLAERRWEGLRGRPRKAKAIGIDPAEGGDSTVMAAVDEYGVIEITSKKTPDTSRVTGEALAFMRKHGVEPEAVVFDRGGGGLEHADRLRSMGYDVRSVGFGEGVMLEPKRGLVRVEERKENREERYAYINRRAQMYGEVRVELDPIATPGFALPPDPYLRRQFAPIPLTYDDEGRLKMPPKPELIKIIGHSPDEADAIVLAVHGMKHRVKRSRAGAAG